MTKSYAGMGVVVWGGGGGGVAPPNTRNEVLQVIKLMFQGAHGVLDRMVHGQARVPQLLTLFLYIICICFEALCSLKISIYRT